MAVTFDANAANIVRVTGATSVTSTALTIGAGSNRVLLATLHFDSNVGSLAVNWDTTGTSTPMSQVVNYTSTFATGGFRAVIFGLVNPATGNRTAQATWTGAAEGIINLCSFTGADQTGGATTFPNTASTAGSSATSTIQVNSQTSDAGVACVTLLNAFNAWSVGTQLYLDNAGAAIDTAGARQTGGATMTFTTTQGAADWVMVACDILAAGAAAAADRKPLLKRYP